VGDDPITDVAGARDAGWQAVLVDRKGRTPGFGIASLADLLPLLPSR
jgi:FMN phosphatase YigB (HAD superfamily)